MIPRDLWTVWLGPIPEVIQKCIDSQKIPGYEHHLITLDNIDPEFKESKYMLEAFQSTHSDGIKYCKMSDYLRMRYLYKYGGIYLDGDVWVLPNKNFDDLLQDGMFAAREMNGFIGSATVGSVPNHPFVKRWIETVEKNFRGDDAFNFESSMEILTNGYAQWSLNGDFKLHDTHYFYPYDHQRGTIKVTKDTRSWHDFYKSWTDTSPDRLPKVSIIIPQLGRPEGLKACLTSIDNLYYPKHLIETIVIDGDQSVPEKVEEGVKKSTGEFVAYLANDTIVEPHAIFEAINVSTAQNKALVAFHEGPVFPDKGNICTHFLIRKDFIPKLQDGQVFSTDFHHVGVDNWLWAQAEKLKEAIHCDDAIITHNHFSKGALKDEVYQKGWQHMQEDRAILKAKLESLNGTGYQSLTGGSEETQTGFDGR